MNKLNHLAIIMDGNGRWAKKRGFLRTNGHEAGANVVSDMCEFCIDNGVKILSLYAFSTENWKRPQKEVDFLMNLLKKFLLLKRDDFIKAVKKLNLKGCEIDETSLNAALDESEPVDLLIRTGGESRLSNFMLWQASYAELFFTPTLWPDFGKDELASIVAKFKDIERRFGGV